jgi:hypothetical protein
MTKSFLLRASAITVIAIVFVLNGSGHINLAHADNWAPVTKLGKGSWLTMSGSRDGKTLILAGANTDVDISRDGGYSWRLAGLPVFRSTWEASSISADGSHMAVGLLAGPIYTSSDYGSTWQARANAGNRGWVSIASSADGLKLLACDWGVSGDAGGSLYQSLDGGATWNALAGTGPKKWSSVASSDDGQTLAAIDNAGVVSVSTDAGKTWVIRNSLVYGSTKSIAMSGDGKTIGIAAGNSKVYVSKDSGLTWKEQLSLGQRNWISIAISADGKTFLAGINGGYLYLSRDAGLSWYQQDTAGEWAWYATFVSGDGSKLAAGDYYANRYLYLNTCDWKPITSLGKHYWTSISNSADGQRLEITTDSTSDSLGQPGQIYSAVGSCKFDWTTKAQSSAGQRLWTDVASSVDGSLVASTASGDVGPYSDSNRHIYNSTDSGSTWTERISTGINEWHSVASSADGGRLIAGGDHLFRSIDGGKNWTQINNPGFGSWKSVASSIDGQKLVAVDAGPPGGSGGNVYFSEDGGNTWNIQTTFSTVPIRTWSSSASSADGTRVLVTTKTPTIGTAWFTGSRGAQWIATADLGSHSWSSSAVGGQTYILGSEDGTVAYSFDSGAHWKLTTPSSNTNSIWKAVAVSADGTALSATDYGGYVYTMSNGVPNASPRPLANIISPSSGTPGTSVTINGSALDGLTFIVLKNNNDEKTYAIKPTSATANSFTFTLPNIPAGTYQVTPYNESNKGSSLQITVIQPTASITLTANPLFIDPAQNVTLTWSTTNLTSCEGLATPHMSLPPEWTNPLLNGSVTFGVNQSEVFILNCTGPGGTKSEYVNVSLKPTNPNPSPSSSPSPSPTTQPTNSPSPSPSAYRQFRISASLGDFILNLFR